MATKNQKLMRSHDADDMIVYSIPEVPVTLQRRPFLQPESDQRLAHTGMFISRTLCGQSGI